MSRATIKRAGRTGLVAGVAVLAVAVPATAHVGVNPTESPADGYAMLQFSVPHGCEGSPTKALRIQVPKSVPSATPQVHPGWEVTTRQGAKTPVELHGEEVTRGVSEIAWTATEAEPLSDDRLDVFGASVRLPAGEEGETVYFPAIQECVRGETRWIQVPAAGESAEELDEPAPAVTLTAVDGGHGGGATDVGVEPASASVAADSGDDGPSTGLVIVALALGGLGLLTGLVALVRGRRTSA